MYFDRFWPIKSCLVPERSSQEPATNCAAYPKVPSRQARALESSWILFWILSPFHSFIFFPHSELSIECDTFLEKSPANAKIKLLSKYWGGMPELWWIVCCAASGCKLGRMLPTATTRLSLGKRKYVDKTPRFQEDTLGTSRAWVAFTHHEKISRTRRATMICKSSTVVETILYHQIQARALALTLRCLLRYDLVLPWPQRCGVGTDECPCQEDKLSGKCQWTKSVAARQISLSRTSCFDW